jgi:YD repeat-containing protein
MISKKWGQLSCNIWESANSCAGRSLLYVLSVDAFSARFDYDNAGKLVGVYTTAGGRDCTALPALDEVCDVERAMFEECTESSSNDAGVPADAGL